MPRQGLTREIILQEAIRLINEKGYNSLSFTVLAKNFDVKPPAMFKHFRSIEELKKSLTLYGIQKLRQALQDSVTATAGETALQALCIAYRVFAQLNPGLYQAIQPAHFVKNKHIEQESIQLMEIFFRVLKSFNIEGENLVHLLRIIRSALHGFVVLEIGFGFGLTANIDISFNYQIKNIQTLVKQFSAAP